ncbi:hypothetical protein ACLB2K_037920 [Fragaria x ananassa]
MATHMRPLYLMAEVEGIMVNKVMVDTGVAVNVITTRTMGLRGIPRSMIQTTSLTVKNFNGQVSRTLGLLFLRVKVGPVSRPTPNSTLKPELSLAGPFPRKIYR